MRFQVISCVALSELLFLCHSPNSMKSLRLSHVLVMLKGYLNFNSRCLNILNLFTETIIHEAYPPFTVIEFYCVTATLVEVVKKECFHNA